MSKKPIQEITDPQRRTLREISIFINKCKFPPTLKDLAEILGITSSSVNDQVNQLVRKGYLRREPRKARGIVIVREPEDEAPDMEPAPVVGQLMFAEENIHD